MEPLYPKIKCRLTGANGNAFSIMGLVSRKLREGKVPEAKIKEYVAESTAGDYNHLLRTAMKWVSVS